MKYFILSISLFLVLNIQSQNWDINVLKDINLNRNRDLDLTFQFFSNSVTPVTIATPIIVYSAGLIGKNKDIKSRGIVMIESIIVSTVVSKSMKYIINRERPFVTYPYLEKRSDGGSPSFPSGHTEAAFATATSLSIAFPKWYVIVPSYIYAGSVGYSRMHLGVHYPSDVLAGVVIGTASSYFTHRVNKWLKGKKNQKIIK
jgi:membrane-associated phospholipid phosphatase